MSKQIARFPQKNILGVLSGTLLLLLTVGVFSLSSHVSGIQLQQRELKIVNPRAGQTTRYRFSMTTQTLTSIGSLRVQFCANDPLVGEPCTAPAGLDVSVGTLASQTGMTGYTIDPSTTANVLILSRTPNSDPIGPASFEIDGVVNPSSSGSYYARIENFASSDASGTHVDFGGLAFSIQGGLSISTEVPPFLLFCVANTIQPYDCSTATGSYVDFGVLSSSRVATGQSKMLICTNAEFGYTVRAQGPTMISGINTIDPLSTADVSRIGQNQFGMNLRANATPSAGQDPVGPGSGTPLGSYNIPNQYKFVSGDVLASSTTTENYRLYTISYIVNVGKNQPPGVYVTTLTYIALASF